jgi:hypothetical protein
MRLTISVLALAVATSAATLPAQETWTLELRPFVGTAIPTGGMREVIGSETLFGTQLAAELRPWLHVLGTVGWAPAETRYVVSDQGLSVFQYDAGVEVNASQPFAGGWQLHPFWGAGAGARTYLYDSGALKDRTCLSGYVATGIELQFARTALRAEARDNVFCYRPPVAGAKAGTRNDLDFVLGFAYHFR